MRTRKTKRAQPRTTAEYRGLSDKSKNSLDRSSRVVSKIRGDKTSCTKASREIGVSPQTVKRWAASALKKRNGRFTAKSSDQLFRVLKIPDEKGVREIGVRGSRQATVLAEYWNALNRYLDTGRSEELERFKGVVIKGADNNEILLPTDRAQLRRLGLAGVLSFESLYGHSA